jgi:Zn-dependent metalloprotease
LSKRGTPEDTAKEFLASHLGFDPSEVAVRTSADTDTARHIWLNQVIGGVQVINAVSNVALAPDDPSKVLSYGTNFVKVKAPAPAQPKLSAQDVIPTALGKLGAKQVDGAPVEWWYFIDEANEAKPVWVFQAETENNGWHWYEVGADATNGEILFANDFVADAAVSGAS